MAIAEQDQEVTSTGESSDSSIALDSFVDFAKRILEGGAIKSYLPMKEQEHAMGRVDKRSITLSPELAQVVDDVVAAGEYASASEVIRDALRQWKDRRDLLGYTVEELRKLVQEGIDSGPGRFTSMDEIKAEARRRFRSGGAA